MTRIIRQIKYVKLHVNHSGGKTLAIENTNVSRVRIHPAKTFNITRRYETPFGHNSIS
jgi:hypothetical protein